ncbi:hypothetical protein SAMN00777080_1269 [Aquiflexum balticum DSM 16537]|uniref:YhhN-like protein n=1 Tax=Aquiflexum balticum DSM 16537 TaxID=758820 RepID=A0A1W2H169_9BACT|nr:hypothetical protein [Aquiflexum balticum]SMD42707.1 hypothetical protein SAMN00777080_1269 [Aquiflexum balticum DSM 16537]
MDKNALTWYHVLIIIGMLVSIPYFYLAKGENRKKHLVIFLILLCTSITEVRARQLQLLKINNTLVVNTGYIIIGISLIFLFFYFILNQSKKPLYLWVVYMAWIIINSIYFQTITTTFQNYSWALASLLIIGMCLYFFYSIFSKNQFENINLIAVPEFWVVSFLMFFYASSFLYFISFTFYYDKMDIELYMQLNFLIKIMGSIMYLVMGLAFYAPYIFRNKVE